MGILINFLSIDFTATADLSASSRLDLMDFTAVFIFSGLLICMYIYIYIFFFYDIYIYFTEQGK